LVVKAYSKNSVEIPATDGRPLKLMDGDITPCGRMGVKGKGVDRFPPGSVPYLPVLPSRFPFINYWPRVPYLSLGLGMIEEGME